MISLSTLGRGKGGVRNRLKIPSVILLPALLLLPACAPAPVQAEEMNPAVPRDLAPQVADADLADLVRGNNEFAFALYPQLFYGR